MDESRIRHTCGNSLCCNPKHLTNPSLEDRFWSMVDKEDGDGCWVFTGNRTPFGYGIFRCHGIVRVAHRVSWELEHGPIPKGEGYFGTCVCHHCDNPPCVRPSHLFLGTHMDNMQDMLRKGRYNWSSGPRGDTHPFAKLSSEDVRAIRSLQNPSPYKIAPLYGVSHATIYDILQYRTWKHVI